MLSSSTIHHPDRNPVLKIPLIHRIFFFAATDVIKVEELSRVCFSFREALEIYGKPVFASFAERESKEFFRFFYELCEWAEDSWMIELMIDAWNENFGDRPEFLREQDQREYANSDLVRRNARRINGLPFASTELIALLEDQNQNNRNNDNKNENDNDNNSSLNFFNCPSMNRCFEEHACAPTHIAARFDRHDILRTLLQKGADINAEDVHGYSIARIALHHNSCRSIFVLLEEYRNRYYHKSAAESAALLHRGEEMKRDDDSESSSSFSNDEKEERRVAAKLKQITEELVSADRKLLTDIILKQKKYAAEVMALACVEDQKLPPGAITEARRNFTKQAGIARELMYRTFDLAMFFVMDSLEVEDENVNANEDAGEALFKDLKRYLFGSSSASVSPGDGNHENDDNQDTEDKSKLEETAGYLIIKMNRFLEGCVTTYEKQ